MRLGRKVGKKIKERETTERNQEQVDWNVLQCKSVVCWKQVSKVFTSIGPQTDN